MKALNDARPYPSYFLVRYQGDAFPEDLRSSVWVYKGEELQRLGEFHDRLIRRWRAVGAKRGQAKGSMEAGIPHLNPAGAEEEKEATVVESEAPSPASGRKSWYFPFSFFLFVSAFLCFVALRTRPAL